MNELQGRHAVVTGASSGLGVDFARILAERGCNVVLVARREERLRVLADAIADEHGVQAHVVPADLAEPEAPAALHRRLAEMGIAVDVLVNNAGFGTFGDFLSVPWERQREMLMVDVVALAHLTHLFASDMVKRNSGYILQVSSIGAYQPSPTYAAYSAAKSFVLSFGEALSYELRHTNVKVSVISPGVTATEFLQVAGQKPSLFQRLSMMPSRKVAEIGIAAMLRGKPSKVAGAMNGLTAWSLRFMPRRATAAIAHTAMRVGSESGRS